MRTLHCTRPLLATLTAAALTFGLPAAHAGLLGGGGGGGGLIGGGLGGGGQLGIGGGAQGRLPQPERPAVVDKARNAGDQAAKDARATSVEKNGSAALTGEATKDGASAGADAAAGGALRSRSEAGRVVGRGQGAATADAQADRSGAAANADAAGAGRVSTRP